jgi:hypothetical protein
MGVMQMSDCISRQAVLDIIHIFFTEEVDKIPTKKTEDGEVLVIHKCQPLFAMNKAICKRIKALPSVPAEQTHEEWCTDCKEYDKEQHCCHRYCKIIRQAVAEIKQAEPTVNAIPMSVIKDIKTDIRREYKKREYAGDAFEMGTAYGLNGALQIIENYLESGE